MIWVVILCVYRLPLNKPMLFLKQILGAKIQVSLLLNTFNMICSSKTYFWWQNSLIMCKYISFVLVVFSIFKIASCIAMIHHLRQGSLGYLGALWPLQKYFSHIYTKILPDEFHFFFLQFFFRNFVKIDTNLLVSHINCEHVKVITLL